MDTPDLAQEFVVDDLEILKVIAHSTRLDILQSLKYPQTVKELAQKLHMPATKLYYHVNLMEKHALIRIVETNIVSGIIEKKYQVTALNYRLQDGLLTKSNSLSKDVDMMLGAIFNTTRSEIKRSIEAKKMTPTSEDKRGLLWHSGLRLTTEQFAEFHQQFEELLRKISEVSKQNDLEDLDQTVTDFGITAAFYPIHRPTDKEVG
jgi:DNA-binding transcriptional ArsR family regulator